MSNLNQELIGLLVSLREAYKKISPELVQGELDEIEAKVTGKNKTDLIELYDQNLSGVNGRRVYIRHRIREEILRQLGSITGPEMSEEQQADLLHFLKVLHQHAENRSKEPEAPYFMELTLLALVFRLLPSA